jgi:hypothetical protein
MRWPRTGRRRRGRERETSDLGHSDGAQRSDACAERRASAPRNVQLLVMVETKCGFPDFARRPSCAFLIAIAVMFSVAGRTSVPAAAEGSSVGHGEGGYVPDFVAIVRRYNASGETFRIEGVCKSARTLFLGIRNVCVERSATLMFHAGHDIAGQSCRCAYERSNRHRPPGLSRVVTPSRLLHRMDSPEH